jgi:hypothetical protein
MTRLTLTLELPEKNALIALAAKELRDPRYQAVLIIREELTRRGVLSQADPTEPVSSEGASFSLSDCFFSNLKTILEDHDADRS